MRVWRCWTSLAIVLLSACSSNLPAIAPLPDVELERFTGRWYVHGSIPTLLERNAYNAVEHYAHPEGNRIATTFTFNAGALDGPPKTYTSTGFVNKKVAAKWGMQFIWPFRAEYLIAYLDEAYSQAIVARSKRDFVWIMTRSPEISEQAYARLVERVVAMGYDVTKLRQIPHG